MMRGPFDQDRVEAWLHECARAFEVSALELSLSSGWSADVSDSPRSASGASRQAAAANASAAEALVLAACAIVSTPVLGDASLTVSRLRDMTFASRIVVGDIVDVHVGVDDYHQQASGRTLIETDWRLRNEHGHDLVRFGLDLLGWADTRPVASTHESSLVEAPVPPAVFDADCECVVNIPV